MPIFNSKGNVPSTPANKRRFLKGAIKKVLPKDDTVRTQGTFGSKPKLGVQSTFPGLGKSVSSVASDVGNTVDERRKKIRELVGQKRKPRRGRPGSGFKLSI